MSLRNSFDDLLSQEVDRKEFLAYLGGTALAITGISGLLKTLTRSPSRTSGYGGGAYGGERGRTGFSK
jgi:hypothetical protein